jgi:hypothetical protein
MSISVTSTTIALLRAAKNINFEKDVYTWKDVVEVLSPLYHPDMRLADVIHILLKSYEELIDEPRFETRRCIDELLMAPVKWNYSLNYPTLETTYTVEEFYNKQIQFMMHQFRFSRCDWCRDVLIITKEEI